MSVESLLTSTLNLLVKFYPASAALVAAVEQHGPAAEPLMVKAIADGKSAFAAAKAANPKLAEAISDFVHTHAGSLAAGHVHVVALENVARGVVGASRMEPEEESIVKEKS